MPENENIIPEAEIVPAEIQEPTMSFTPVSSTDEIEVVVPQAESPAEVIIPTVETPASTEGPEEDEYETVELNEQTAWEFLKSKKGLEIDNIDDLLTPKEQKKYAPEMEKFSEFIEKTGNKNYNDFLETQKDWSTESADNVLKTYLKLSNPGLSEKEVNHLYNKNYNTDGLDEELDEDEFLGKGINVKSDLIKANEFLEKRKQEFNAVGGSDDYIPEAYREAKRFLEDQTKQEEQFNIAREESRNDFIAKTDSLFNNNFEGFKIQLGDEKNGFEEFSIKPENLEAVKEFQSDSNNLIQEFLDTDTGQIKDVKGYHEAIYMAKNYKSELNKAYALGMAKQLELNDKLSKNIQPDNIRSLPNNRSAGVTFSKD